MKKREKRVKTPQKVNRALVTVYFVLRILVVAVLVHQIFNQNWANVGLCFLTLVLFMIPSFVEKKIKVDVPDTLEIIILLFIFSAEILGEIREYYLTFPYWDTMLHTINGFLMAAIGFSLVDILNQNKKFSIQMSPLFVAMVAFCFSMTVGVVWEFFEFGMDWFFHTDMQKDTWIHTVNSVLLNPAGRNVAVTVPIESVVVNGAPWQGYLDIGLIDTMKDLLVNFIGAVVYSLIGLFYIKGRTRGKFARRFILTVKDDAEAAQQKDG